MTNVWNNCAEVGRCSKAGAPNHLPWLCSLLHFNWKLPKKNFGHRNHFSGRKRSLPSLLDNHNQIVNFFVWLRNCTHSSYQVAGANDALVGVSQRCKGVTGGRWEVDRLQMGRKYKDRLQVGDAGVNLFWVSFTYYSFRQMERTNVCEICLSFIN